MTRSLRTFGTVFRREIATIARTPSYILLSVGLFTVLFGFLLAGSGGAGFVPAVVGILVPVELLVPLVAVLLGYRTLHADAESGELAVIRTYPVSTVVYVGGIAAARLIALVAIVCIPLAVVGGYVWLTASPGTDIYATTGGIDSPALFVRFIALTALLGIPYLLFAAAVSALAGTRRGAIAIAVLLLAVGTVGGDLAIFRVLGVGLQPKALPTALAITPNAAFRGLVFEYVVGAVADSTGRFIPRSAVFGLFGWSMLGFATALGVMRFTPEVGRVAERIRSRLK